MSEHSSIKVTFSQHKGHGDIQQDALWDGRHIFQRCQLAPRGRLLLNVESYTVALADGLAVSPMAQRASRLALEALAAEISSGASLDRGTIRKVHGRLCNVLAKGKSFGSATTLVAIEYKNFLARVFSVGDSRAYRITADGQWSRLTRDHTVLNSMIERGEADLNVEYASIYDTLEYCLIADDAEWDFPVHSAAATLNPGDAIFLCTDGVYDAIGEDLLVKLVSHPIEPLEQIKIWHKHVLKAGAPDNFSMLLFSVIS